MRRILVFLFALFLCAGVGAKTVPLATVSDADGGIVVSNAKGAVKDRIHIENHSDTLLEIVVTGRTKKTNAIVTVCTTFVGANDEKYVATEYEGKLKAFSELVVKAKGHAITSFTADTAWNDLYFAIAVVEKSGGDVDLQADELSKWKRLLDDGAITPEEFEAKKKQILGL